MKLPFKSSRKACRLSAESAANALHIDKRTLYRIEAGQQAVTPELVWNMARLYDDPGLIRWYRSEVDPIGRRVDPPVLNGIVNNPQAVHHKLAEELEEATQLATQLARLITNKMTAHDFTEPEKCRYFELYGECVSDIKQVLAEVEGAMAKMFGLETLEVVGSAHRDKMFQKGYLRTKSKDGQITL